MGEAGGDSDTGSQTSSFLRSDEYETIMNQLTAGERNIVSTGLSGFQDEGPENFEACPMRQPPTPVIKPDPWGALEESLYSPGIPLIQNNAQQSMTVDTGTDPLMENVVENSQQFFFDPPSTLDSLINGEAGATGAMPPTNQWLGDYDFHVSFSESTGRKKWMYSPTLRKLFCEPRVFVPMNIHLNFEHSPCSHLLLRVLPLFTQDQSTREVVSTCCAHATIDDAGVESFHLIRSDAAGCHYSCDSVSKRLSVVVPVEPPPPGTSCVVRRFMFQCLTSCIGGMNRKPICLIFTLECPYTGRLLGRDRIDCRTCKCPKRDHRGAEEQELKTSSSVLAMDLANSLGQNNLVLEQTEAKKRKKEMSDSDGEEEYCTIKVHRKCLEKMQMVYSCLLMQLGAETTNTSERRRTAQKIAEVMMGGFNSSTNPTNKKKNHDEEQ